MLGVLKEERLDSGPVAVAKGPGYVRTAKKALAYLRTLSPEERARVEEMRASTTKDLGPGGP